MTTKERRDDLFAKRRVEIAASVKNGATAIFMELPALVRSGGGPTKTGEIK